MATAARACTAIARANVLGVAIDGWNIDDFLTCVTQWAASSPSTKTVLYANVHVLNTAYTDPRLFHELRAASTVYSDGSGVVLGARLLGTRLPPRLTGADWIDSLCSRAAREGLKLFLLGGAPGVAAAAAAELLRRHPGLSICGTHHGFTDTLDAAVVDTVNQSSAHILLIGMGTPRQELWIRANRERLQVPVLWAVGALFDFVTGVERRAPHWMRDHHLEWAARLRANPRSHWRRYLIGNPLFLARVLRQRMFGLPSRLTRAGCTDAP